MWKIFELYKIKYSKEQYYKASERINKVIKCLLLIIVVIEIAISYKCIKIKMVEIYIYNILFPFVIFYLSLFVRSYRAEKEELTKTKRGKQSKKVKIIDEKSKMAMDTISNKFSDVVLSVFIPYVILLFSNKNYSSFVDLLIVIIIFALSEFINLYDKL